MNREEIVAEDTVSVKKGFDEKRAKTLGIVDKWQLEKER
jgi:hypothetical protein